MSVMNDVMNKILKIANMKDLQNKKIDHNIDKLEALTPKTKQLKSLEFEQFEFNKRIVSKISSKKSKSNLDIIYFHGGCYAMQIQNGHWALITYIARETGANIYSVDYPLIPENTGSDAIEYSLEYYKYHLKNTSNNIILLGDSSGAGLATSLCMTIRDMGLKQVKRLILLSPYLDTLCSDPRQIELQNTDSFLSVEGLSRAGKIYIGKLKSDDYRVNPIHGDFKNLPPITIFTSNRDILYIDSLRLVTILKKQDSKYDLYEEMDVMHDWMIIDQLPESIESRKQLSKVIMDTN